ncbi:General transcription factor 3C polypeptide 4 [Frankliniella fusca]|uniref:General transcription factor 3C polypeptide 4 n=1 Tax=Frankliniella fusca TaxID=407009 RepID=A0AAE1LB50_9NEOP|nr:General transcription factor 3C polypeptide 4 [Frankliniella fusca]
MRDRKSVYHMILDATLTPSLDNASMPPPRFTQVAWSPPGLLHYGRCLLATLTNYGSAKVEYSWSRQWRQVIDVSESWSAVCRLSWESRALSEEEQYKELCRREAQLRIVAIAWSGLRGKASSPHCLLAAAHRDGVVSFWQVPAVRLRPAPAAAPAEDEEALTTGLVFTLQTGLAQGPGRPVVTQLQWAALAGRADHLLVGDSSGRVRMWDTALCTRAAGVVAEEHQGLDVYPTADRIRVTKLVDCALSADRSERLVVVVKGSFLLVALVDDAAHILATAIRDFQHVALTGVVVTKPGSLVVSAREGDLYHVQCSVEDGGLRIAVDAVPSTLSFANCSCFGLAASEHRMIWVAASSVSKMYDHLAVKQPTTFYFLTVLDPCSAGPMLVDNPGRSLTRYLDCLEVLRVQCQKHGLQPPVDVTEENLDQRSNYQLRLSLWLSTVALTISNELEADITRRLTDLNNRMRQLLFARHACELMERMLAGAAARGATEDELNAISLLRAWMLAFSGTPVASGHWRRTCERVREVLAGSQGLEDLVREDCYICEAAVESPTVQEERWMLATCARGHAVPRCSLSLTPCVTVPYFTCRTCRVTAHPSFVSDSNPLCVFCDGILRPDECVEAAPGRTGGGRNPTPAMAAPAGTVLRGHER